MFPFASRQEVRTAAVAVAAARMERWHKPHAKYMNQKRERLSPWSCASSTTAPACCRPLLLLLLLLLCSCCRLCTYHMYEKSDVRGRFPRTFLHVSEHIFKRLRVFFSGRGGMRAQPVILRGAARGRALALHLRGLPRNRGGLRVSLGRCRAKQAVQQFQPGVRAVLYHGHVSARHGISRWWWHAVSRQAAFRVSVVEFWCRETYRWGRGGILVFRLHAAANFSVMTHWLLLYHIYITSVFTSIHVPLRNRPLYALCKCIYCCCCTAVILASVVKALSRSLPLSRDIVTFFLRVLVYLCAAAAAAAAACCCMVRTCRQTEVMMAWEERTARNGYEKIPLHRAY